MGNAYWYNTKHYWSLHKSKVQYQNTFKLHVCFVRMLVFIRIALTYIALFLSHKVVAKGTGAFLLKVCIHAAVHVIMLSKKHQRSSTMQEEGLTNEGRHHLLLQKKHCRIMVGNT